MCELSTNCHFQFKQAGHPGCAEFAAIVANIDFDAARERWNVASGDPIPGKKARNFVNYDFVKYAHGVRDTTVQNTKMAPWVAEAARKAYPWENDESYSREIPLEVETRLVFDRGERPIEAAELTTWCELIAEAEA